MKKKTWYRSSRWLAGADLVGDVSYAPKSAVTKLLNELAVRYDGLDSEQAVDPTRSLERDKGTAHPIRAWTCHMNELKKSDTAPIPPLE